MFFKTLLLVDDDPDDRLLFSEVIQEIDEDIKIAFATNGAEALQMLQDTNTLMPEIIFLDLNMPKMNGKQCLKQLKKNPLLSSIPVIIYSTSTATEDIDDSMNLGADYFLVKPITMKELKTELLYVLTENWTKQGATK